jgi:hypothetical protein
MSKTPGFPAYYYSPDGEARIFQSADEVPEGWTTKHPDHHIDDKKPEPAAPPVDKLTREEVIAALVSGGIEFKKNAGTAALEKQLRESAIAYLTDKDGGQVSFPADISTRKLLALLPATSAPPAAQGEPETLKE